LRPLIATRRSQETKEITLRKALISIIAAAALITLAVPAAQATFDASLPTKSPHAKITKAVKVTKHKAHAQANQSKSTPKTGVRSLPTIGTLTAPNWTDEQLCEYWGLNCDLVTSSSTSESSVTAPGQSTTNDWAGT
jgi:hypothetical protein